MAQSLIVLSSITYAYKAQNMLDQIFIGIVPLGLTLLCYYLLKKKNISITVLIIGVIILSILLSLLGIA